MSRRRGLALTLALVLTGTALGGGACGGTDHDPAVVEIVVPLGTSLRLARGEDVDVMPEELHLRVGDTLRIRNDDVAIQTVGPYVVPAGRSFELTYGSPGRFQGVCTLSGEDRYDIVVTA